MSKSSLHCCPILPLGIIVLTNLNLYYLRVLPRKFEFFRSNNFKKKIFKDFLYFYLKTKYHLPNCDQTQPLGHHDLNNVVPTHNLLNKQNTKYKRNEKHLCYMYTYFAVYHQFKKKPIDQKIDSIIKLLIITNEQTNTRTLLGTFKVKAEHRS